MTTGSAGIADVESYLDRLESTVGRTSPRGCLAVNTTAELRDPPAAVARRTREYRDRLQAGLLAALGRAEELGEAPPGSAEFRAAAIAPIVIAFNLLVAAGAGETEVRDLLDSARSLARGARQGGEPF